jgi:hypothetical protein
MIELSSSQQAFLCDAFTCFVLRLLRIYINVTAEVNVGHVPLTVTTRVNIAFNDELRA